MSTIFDAVASQFDSTAVASLGERIGADPRATESAIETALPLLIGALERNSRSHDGAGSLLGALTRDHDGSVLDDVLGSLGSQRHEATGTDILGHVFGARTPAVAEGVGRQTGLSGDQIMRLLSMLAPLVMGALGKQQRSKSVDTDELSQWLGRERTAATQRVPAAGGLLGSLLDRDGDGSIADDIGRIGIGMLGNAMKGRNA